MRALYSHTSPDCATMNAHYAAISTHLVYNEPLRKNSCVDIGLASNWPSEYAIFNVLDHLKSTATGPDGLPTWFLRLAASAYSKSIAHLFSISLSNARVPTQNGKRRASPQYQNYQELLPPGISDQSL